MLKFIKSLLAAREKTVALAEWLLRYEDVATGQKWTMGPYKNKVVQGGLDNQAALLIGEVSSITAVTHCVIGSSAVAAALDDDISDMGEVARKAITSKIRSGAMARLRTFLSTSEGNGNHQCVGLVARGTDTVGSGTLLNRLVQPFSKTSSTNLTIEIRWTNQGVS